MWMDEMIDDDYWCIDGWIDNVLNKWVQISTVQYIIGWTLLFWVLVYLHTRRKQLLPLKSLLSLALICQHRRTWFACVFLNLRHAFEFPLTARFMACRTSNWINIKCTLFMSQGAKGDPGLSPGQAPAGDKVNDPQRRTTASFLSGCFEISLHLQP